jgi:hypothetical protein
MTPPAPRRTRSAIRDQHSCLAVVTKGPVRKRSARVEEDAVAGTVVEMPAEERHEDLFGREGAQPAYRFPFAIDGGNIHVQD